MTNNSTPISSIIPPPHPKIQLAQPSDATSITQIISTAYSKYITRMGKLPAPMQTEYSKLIDTQTVYVLRNVGEEVIGSIVLNKKGDTISVEDLVVATEAQGQGFGRFLMRYAEDKARELGLVALTLFANEVMHENIRMYTRMGFVEVDRRMEDGFKRVYFRKELV